MRVLKLENLMVLMMSILKKDIFMHQIVEIRVYRFSTKDFLSDISGLTCETTYHYRAYSENGDDIEYGGDHTLLQMIVTMKILQVLKLRDLILVIVQIRML